MKKLPVPKKSERGQSLLELALSLLVLLMLLTGSVEFGLALFQFVTIRDAAQEGAVYGSIQPADVAGIKWRAVDAASDILHLSPNAVTVKTNHNKACEGSVSGVPNSIEVTVIYHHPITFPFVADMIGHNTIQLIGKSTNTILTPTCP
jgi:Flp pilus assembly protein TadG